MARKKKRKKATPDNEGVVLDLETTGLSATSGARVIEIGAVRVYNGMLQEEFQTLVNPRMTLPDITREITGITQEEVDHAPPAEEVIPQLLQFIGRDKVVAHNAMIEQGFLASECQCIGLLPPNIEYLCTLKLSRRYVENAPNAKLETLAKHLKLPVPERFHRALDDARTTAHLWLYLQELIRAKRAEQMELFG